MERYVFDTAVLADLMDRFHYNQTTLAEALDVDRDKVLGWVLYNEQPTLDHLGRMADLFKLKTDLFFKKVR